MTDDLVAARQEKHYASSYHIDVHNQISNESRMGKISYMYSKSDLSKQKRNGLVSCSQHSYFGTCPFGGAGGGGGGVLAVKVCKICTNSIMLPTVTMMNGEHVKKVF